MWRGVGAAFRSGAGRSSVWCVSASAAAAIAGNLGGRPSLCEASVSEKFPVDENADEAERETTAQRMRTLSRRRREVVTEGHADYIDGIQIWGVGIKDDPIPGEKRGKGVQHLRSTQWIYDLACFIQDHNPQISAMMSYALHISETANGYDFRYFVNCSEGLFHKALDEGLQTKNSRDLLLMASWTLMAAAEVNQSPFYDRNFMRHTSEWREFMREEFYRQYLNPDVDFVKDPEDVGMERVLGKYGLSSCRFDQIPLLALERLDIHNELCRVKWKTDPAAWMREGFLISSRVDSMHRHYWSIHAHDYGEDHIAHGIWNLMALYHVLVVFPEKNDLPNYKVLRGGQPLRASDPSERIDL